MNTKITGRKLQGLENGKQSTLAKKNTPEKKKGNVSMLPNNLKIDFDDGLKDYQIKDGDMFSNYLLLIWKDLASRSEDNEKGVSKLTFIKYYELPGIISERLYRSFDKSKSGYLSPKDFIEGMLTLFTESFQVLSKFIFHFYDFDNDGYITKDDVRVVLSYVPLQKTYSKMKMKYEQDDFNDRVESQSELHELLNKSFGKLDKMNEEQFINLIDNVNSDIFIFILMFLLEKRPFTQESMGLFLNTKNEKTNNLVVNKTPKVGSHKIASPSLKSKFVSPSGKNRALNLTGGANGLNAYAGKPANASVKNSGFKKASESPKLDEKKDNVKQNQNKPHRRFRQMLNNLEDSTPQYKPFTFINNESNGNDTSSDVEDKDTEESAGIAGTQPIAYGDESDKKTVIFSGYLYKITHTKKLKNVYFRLIGKDFYFFKTKEDEMYKGMHNLSGIYIRENSKEVFDGKVLYNFSICYPQKTRTYYTESESDYNQWVTNIGVVLNAKKILDEYDIKEKIGKGKFGGVKLAIHKESQRKVAIKIMSKRTMANQDGEGAKTEIDIGKVCQHPNIIKGYDVVDTKDYIYIIMEYLSGKDLFSYIEERGYRLPEKRAAEIIHKLGMAVYYMHSYGIVHRDLKPENILMTDNTDNADIRVLDFGLSKIIGPNEKCNEPYGTLSYVAPEVGREMPYDKRVDIWAIGVITYLLLCGFLPFDDEHSEREIARQTLQNPVPYPQEYWKGLSKEVHELVDKTMKKKPEERLTLEQILDHPWFKKYNLIPDFRKNITDTDCKFLKYTVSKE